MGALVGIQGQTMIVRRHGERHMGSDGDEKGMERLGQRRDLPDPLAEERLVQGPHADPGIPGQQVGIKLGLVDVTIKAHLSKYLIPVPVGLLIAVQSELFMLAAFFLLIGLLVDLLHRVLDPRLKSADDVTEVNA